MPRKTRGPSKTPSKRKHPGRSQGNLPGILKPLRWLRYAVLLFIAASLAGVALFRFVPVPFTPLMLIRLAEQGSDGRPLRLEKSWRTLGRISPRLQAAVVASEDQRFFAHHGFDWDAIGSAFTANGRGRRKLGASTISQQTAKNLFLWPDRTWLRKGLEAYFTVLIETLWPKRRILEVYLNIIETGDGSYGAEAAARRYFHTEASGLGASQAALIAASLPNPRAWSPAHPSGYLLRRRTWILRQMDHLGPMPWDSPVGASSRPVARPRPPGGARDPFAPSAPSSPTPVLPAPAAPSLPMDTPAFPSPMDTPALPSPPAAPESPGPWPESPETEAPVPPDSTGP